MSAGLQTVYRQFITGPAQRASQERRALFYPELTAIAGETDASKAFTKLVAASTPLREIAAALAPRLAAAARSVSEERILQRFPGITAAIRLLDLGAWNEASAELAARSDEISALLVDLDHVHGALLAYLAGGTTSPVGEYALKLMKLLWIAARVGRGEDRKTGSEPITADAFINEFWRVGGPSVPLKLPTAGEDGWAAAGPAAIKARKAKEERKVSAASLPAPADLAAARQELQYLQTIQRLTLPPPPPAAEIDPVPAAGPGRAAPAAAAARTAAARDSVPAPAPGGRTGADFVPADVLDAGFRSQISARTAAVIKQIGFKADVHSIRNILAGIDAVGIRQGGELGFRPYIDTLLLGGRVIEIDTDVFGEPMCDEPPLPCHCDLLVDLDAKHGTTPRVHILGTGKAYRIDQTHERYLPGQLVHTENHEGGATRQTSFRKLDRSEQTEETESETETFRESDTTTHDQFDTAKEIAKAAQEESESSRGMEAGVTMTGSYGAASISASLSGHQDTSSSNANQTSEKIATRSAKEIIAKAVERVTQRSRSRRIVKSLTETERSDVLTLDNSKNPSRTDFYRAIDQEYRNQLVYVGERLMVRVTLQEPMAYLLWALTKQGGSGVVLPKPVKPSITPDSITTATASALAAAYGVKGLRPAPANITVSHHVSKTFVQDEPPWHDLSGAIDIPIGWKATSGIVNMLRSTGGGTYIMVALGTGSHVFPQAGSTTMTLSGVEQKLGYAIRAHDNEFSMVFVVTCAPTEEAMRKWQIDTFDAIMAAYNAKQDAYDAQVAAAQFTAGPGMDERNPAINRMLIEQELQKFVLGATYPPFYFRGFDSMKFGEDCKGATGSTLPEPDFVDGYGETPWIIFLSQLYEWKNMTYRFLPYSFGKRSHWKVLRGRTSNDPYFENAISAGAITIDLPVAPHMTEAFLYFLDTGKIWSGGSMPVIGDPAYQDLAIAIRDSEIKDGEPVGDPWFTRVPTSMVYLDSKPNAL